MEHKVYKIEHLDTGMKYIGYTSGTLAQRWYQHYNDPNSAVYQALRSEGHRMTMELMATFDSKEQALRKENECIHALDTIYPNGWNRKVGKPAENPKHYRYLIVNSRISEFGGLICPNCENDHTHIANVEVYTTQMCVQVFEGSEVHVNHHTKGNPSIYEGGIRIYFRCEHCFNDSTSNTISPGDPPPYEMLIEPHKGRIYVKTLYYVESAS